MTRLNEALRAQQTTARVQQQEQPVIVPNSIASLLDNIYYPQKKIITTNTDHQLQISQTTNVVSVVEHSIKLTNSQLKMQCVRNVIFSTCVDPSQ